MYKQRRLISFALVIPLVVSLFAAFPITAPAAARELQQSIPIWQDPSYSFEERAANLVSRLTLSQKAGQLISSMANGGASITVDGKTIASYGWWNEALHGVSAVTTRNSSNASAVINTTSYPTDLTVASSWDPELLYREASMISDEAREVMPQNSLNLDFYSPTVNMHRDPRWGRNDESYGEDPLLAAAMAAQFVNGMQGQDMQGNLLPEGDGYLKTITTLKHYAANNSEGNRLNGTATYDERASREYYTAQFRMIVEMANPGSVMSSYNNISVTPYQSYSYPAAASPYLIDNLMRQTFGFQGYFTSDCDAVYTITGRHNWTPPGWSRPMNTTERSAWALAAGEDLECNTGYNDGINYRTNVPTAISQNLTTPNGLFTENDVDVALTRLFTARMKLGEFDDVANEPWVAQARARVPSWTNSNSNLAITETPERLAMAREVGSKSIVLLKNNVTTKKDGTTGELLPMPVPATGPFSVYVIGYFSNPSSMYLGGYSSSQQSNGIAKMVNGYNGLRNAILTINPDATVTYAKGFTNTSTSASGLTTVDTTAVNNAANYDYVVVYVGTDSGTAREDNDRTSLSLPGAQASLISQVVAKNPNTIVYMETVGEVDVTPFEPAVSAMLWSSYNGMRKGEALADVILGNYNPSGHLPFIWYPGNGSDTSIIPPITDYTLRATDTLPGRTYMYYTGPLSYPFGWGLSYTTFSFSNLQIDNHALNANDTMHVSVDITNTGAITGAEVVQLYVNTPDADPALERPIKRLEGFQKVTLNAGETKTVDFTVEVPDLAFFDNDLNKWVVDNGRYGVQISTSSADANIQLQDYVQVSGTLTPILEVVTVKPHQADDEALDIPARVIYQKGRTIVPQVTVAMNDDTLYGYILKDNSKPFPAGMTFEYSSNRPEVVSVGVDGVIRAVGGGVATVTVTVNYEGVSKSTHFVAVVKADVSLSSITANGMLIDEFSPTVFSYNVIVPVVSGVPFVAATPTDPDATATVEQAVSVPGQATITVSSGGELAVYTVAFAHDVSLSSIRVNGKPISAFSPDVFDYSMLVPTEVMSIPQVEATATDTGNSVVIAQATSLPGQATITVGTGSEQAIYTVSFQRPTVTVSDEFDSEMLGPQWFWIRENPATWSLTSNPGSMTIRAEQGDTYTSTNTAKNILLQNASGDWIIESKLVFSVRPNTSYQQGGLTVYQDDDNYIKLDWEAQGTNTRIQQIREVNRSVNSTAYVSANNIVPSSGDNANTVWFRIAKSGTNFTGYYSVDGINFTALTTQSASFNDIKVGLYSNNGSGTTSNLYVSFDYFRAASAGEVVNLPPEVAADPTTQSVQYTDAIQEVTITATDAAIDLPLSASTQWSQDGGAFQAGLPEWLGLTSWPCTSDDVLGTCTWTLAGTAPVQAGTFVVRTTVSDGYISNFADTTIVVEPEDAFIEYTGETIKLIGEPLALRATVWDSAASGYMGINPESDPSTIGDITKIWIAFDIYPAAGCLTDIPTTLYAQVEDTGDADDGIGTASETFTSNSEASFCVMTRLVAGPDGGANQWYTASNAESALTFYEPSGQFATGGGWIADPDGSKGNFGFHARYLKNDKAKGGLVYVFRGIYQDEPADFVIKSNAVDALAFSGNTFPIQATLQGKCTIQINRASDGTLLFSDGNATFQASVIDTDGEGDAFSMIVYYKSGIRYKDIPMTQLGGGNVVIHSK